MFRVVIVGSGPAAFYTAQHVLKGNASVAVDMFEKLPMPFGLVRFGIAPDHSDAKKVINKFDAFASAEPRFSFFGNVNVGRDVSVAQLREQYDAVVLAYGAEQPKKLGICHEGTTKGVHSAHEFVKWVNGFPSDSPAQTPPIDLSSTDTAVIVGQGNVALDVARILLTPLKDLAKTDIPDTVLASLEKSTISQVHLVARRGPYQTAFTAKELREMTKLPGTSLAPTPILSTLPYVNSESDESLDRGPKRLMQILHSVERDPSAPKQWHLNWFLSPREIILNTQKHLEAVRFQRMDPVASASPLGSKVTTNPMEYVDIPCGLLITSLGYTGNPITTSTSEVPFDSSKGLIPNTRGRVLDVSHKVVPGLYASGWIKRGAVGVIAATMYDAIETAESVLQDVGSTKPASSKSGFNGIAPLLKEKGIEPVSYKGWKVLDAFERAEGVKRGKEREKVVDLRIVDQVLKNQR